MKKGEKHSEETIVKIKEARDKQVITPESNKKRSETQKGRKFSKESLKKMSEHAKKRFTDKKNHPHYGGTNSKETREKRSKALKGRSYEDLHGLKKSTEIRKKIKDKRANQVFPKTDTSIEIKIQNFLKELGIEFYTHQYMRIKYPYQCDILIPSLDLIIECDGDYWHGNLEVYDNWNKLSKKQKVQKITDHLRTNELENEGFRVVRLWESDIKRMDLKEFKEKIK